MKANLFIREMVKKKGMKFTTLAAMIGIDRRVLDKRLKQQSLTIHKLNETIKPLGYKVMIVPIEKNITDGYEIES